MGRRAAEAPIVEASHVLDTFATELSVVEKIGSCARFILTTEQHTAEGGTERVVVAKVVIPLDAVPPAIRKTIATLMLPHFGSGDKNEIWVG